MEPVHMLDADSNFCKGNVDSIIKCSAELSDPNAPYAVVSIVGAQSSGKSYLMNCLFGTKFPVMNAEFGRSQTSRGIMISSCIQPSLVLLDVEGFDGREKGEDTLFEKRAALFALVVSDLMMINMSIRDIGREQGGATPLFRTIFQERTKLPQGITKILIVIRFYDGETPLDVLRRDVLKSMEKVAVATLYCRQLIEDTIISLNSSEEFKLWKAEKSQERFEEISYELQENIKARYNLKTEKYDPDVRDNARQCLVERLHTAFQIVAEERKAHQKRKKHRLINYGITTVTMGASVGYSLLSGDFVHPIVRSARYLWNSATTEPDSDLPSESVDQICDLLG